MSHCAVHELFNADCGEPQLVSVHGKPVVLFASPRPGRTPNEDCVAVVELPAGQIVMILSDGMGGGPRGADASRLTVSAIVDALRTGPFEPGSQRSRILDGFEKANQAVLALSSGAGATLVVAELHDGLLRTYHAGDSACLLCGQRGKVKYRTIDHSLVSYAQEAGLLSEDEALRHSERHIVSNVIGDQEMSVQVGPPVKLAARDTIVVASDGVFDNASTEEIVGDVRAGPIAQATSRLLARVQGRMLVVESGIGKPDDITLAVLRPGGLVA